MRVRIVGHQAELREIGRVTTAAAAGRGGSVVVSGEAGIGKSTLLDAAADQLDGFTLLRATGTEFEQDLLYAALHQLCAPLLEHRHKLPDVQQHAIEAVFGLGAQTSPDPLMVGFAILGLVREAVRERPVCCVVDDVQWVDEASRRALVFVARRVTVEPVALVLASRDAGSVAGIADLPRITLTGLDNEDARALVNSEAPTGIDADVFDRILAEARGNPLALLEFARHGGPFGVPGPHRSRTDVVAALEAQFARRFELLPEPARPLVVLAAAEQVGDIGLLRRAAERLGLDGEDFALAEGAGLLSLGPRLRFRHPLVRSAVYASASAETRRRVHGALAGVLDPETDSDRRAWHRAHAVIDADEGIATELARSSDRARLRGGYAAAAAFMERAGELTPDPGRRAARLLTGAQLRLRAGAPNEARELVAQAERHLLDEQGWAIARLLRARIEFQVSHSPQATATLVDMISGSAPDQATEAYLEAFTSFMYNENEPGRLNDLGTRIRERLPERPPERPVEFLLTALLDQIMLPVDQAVPAMRTAVAECRVTSGGTAPWRMNLACQVATDLREDVLMAEIADRQVDFARRDGVLATLPQALRYQSIARVALGRFDDAAASLDEARAIDESAGTIPVVGPDLVLAGFRGDVERFRRLAEPMGRGERPLEIAGEQYATTVLHNGLGDYETALNSALAAQRRHQAGFYSIWAVYPELVEAAARLGRTSDAVVAMDHLEALARANPAPWAVAERSQARALLELEDDPEPLYRQAIDNFARTGIGVLHARAHLTYGEWLRRENRRADARVELRTAHDMLVRAGARAFADRANRELLATGDPSARSGGDALAQLTAQERSIVEKVVAGATNKDVATMLFLSTRTVDAHLRNVYRKLGISSRRQLRELVPPEIR
ncbi:ATP-binding protein [Amycolatopsis minnesotensis]|uniref:LuxR family transcriptional regulator n=1 Tax=Amycolatopsis minnesotensis TaxID=337894 RepID=A0ABP5DAY5_9PSEU